MIVATNRFVLAAALSLIFGASPQARADLLLDWSPATTGADLQFADGSPWSNNSDFQNFGENFMFGSPVTLSGMDIYTVSAFPFVGMSVTVRLWADSAGLPGALLNNFTETVSAVDNVGTVIGTDDVRVHADFTTPLSLAVNTTYWIGMSGTSAELGQYGLGGPNAPGDGGMAQFFGTSFNFFASTIGDMAFRLEGSNVAVPEPSSLVVAGSIGILSVGLAWRRRKARVTS